MTDPDLPRCRHCAENIEYPAGGPWRHTSTNSRDCRDLLGRKRHARPTRSAEQRMEQQ